MGKINVKLRGYQEEAVKALIEMNKQDRFSTLINIPTGGGKTRIATYFCSEMLGKKTQIYKILWLADRKLILDQAAKKFKEKKYALQCIFSNADTHSKEVDITAEVVVYGVRSLSLHLKDNTKERKFNAWLNSCDKLIVVYDEAHHIGANGIEEIFEYLSNNQAKFGLIGMTATLFRDDAYIDRFHAWFKDGWDKENEKIVHDDTRYGDRAAYKKYIRRNRNGVIFNNRIQPATIEQLINGGWLMRPKLIKITDYANGVCSEDAEIDYLADRITRHHEEWGKTVVYVANTTIAQKLADKLSGIAYKYTSTSNKDEEGYFDQFKEKGTAPELKVVIVVQKLDEGVDIPDLETIYLYEPISSPVALRQRIGRVLRTSAGKKEARIIWQEYPKKHRVLETAEVANLLSIDWKAEEQSKESIQTDKDSAYNGVQLPAAKYLKEIEITTNTIEYTLSECVHQNILKTFSRKDIEEADALGYYYSAVNPVSSDFIYVRNQEKVGYEQFERILDNDKRMYHFTTFSDYAKVLKTTETKLLKEVKESCFYLPNRRKSDYQGKDIAKRLYVKDEQIIKYFEWFIGDGVKYEPCDKKSVLSEGTKDNSSDSNITPKPRNPWITSLAGFKVYALANYQYKAEKRARINKPKEYSDSLCDVTGTYNYSEIQSAKVIMSLGASLDPNDDTAFSYTINNANTNNSNTTYVVERGTKRKLREARGNLLYATALVNVPNHILVSVDDVKKYEDAMEEVVGKSNVKAFLMALGYANNDVIIREQCRLIKAYTKKKLIPRLLQYMVYEKIYQKLWKMVKFKKQRCVNFKRLKYESSKILNFYGISLASDLTPVEDVIYDYRPYLKAVPYYQGIKPEFLCRMVNDIIQTSSNASDTKIIVDAYGGSGAYSMNSFFNKANPATRIFNDYGKMNVSFYNYIKNNADTFIQEVEKLFERAFLPYDETKEEHLWFFMPFYFLFAKLVIAIPDDLTTLPQEEQKKAQMILNKIECIIQPINKTEDLYMQAYNKKSQTNIDDALKAKYKGITDNSAVYDDFRKVEKYIHTFILKIQALYSLLISDEINFFGDPNKVIRKYADMIKDDKALALVFFYHHLFLERQLYDDCTIEKIGKAMVRYKSWIKNGEAIFKNVTTYQSDATDVQSVINTTYNTKDTIYYADIPYSDTSAKTYTLALKPSDFFNSVDNYKGNYIVSSRWNTGVRWDKKLLKYHKVRFWHSRIKKIKPCKKRFMDLVSFLYSFSASYNDDDINKYGLKKHITKPLSSPAKYVWFSYTNGTEYYTHYEDSHPKTKFVTRFGKEKLNRAKRNYTKIDKDSVRRMLVDTSLSIIPVELMITDVELNVGTANVITLDKGMYALPSFKTGIDGGYYKREPVTIIMEYEVFVQYMLNISDKSINFIDEDHKDIAAAFRAYYDTMRAKPADNQE